jgi:hypothetical protein
MSKAIYKYTSNTFERSYITHNWELQRLRAWWGWHALGWPALLVLVYHLIRQTGSTSANKHTARMMITLFWKAGEVNGVLSSKQTYPRVCMELSSRTIAQFYTFQLHAIVENEIGLFNRKTLSPHRIRPIPSSYWPINSCCQYVCCAA